MKIEELEYEIKQLPIGYISHKVIRGKECYYHQWKEDGKLKGRYLKEGELEPLQELILERHRLQVELRYEKARQGQIRRLTAYATKYYLGLQVPIGEQSYERLIQDRLFYVDKTEFIKEWWDSKDRVTLITRPRRFGKTLNMHMVENFFSNRYAGRSDLFDGLAIWKYKQFRELQGTYPVIFLSFGAVKMNTAEGIKNQLAGQIRLLLLDYQYLEMEGIFTEEERIQYQEYCNVRSYSDILLAIHFLCKTLYRIYGKKVIILLDEYDTPMLEAWTSGIWAECADFIRSMFSSLFKTNEYLHKALLTGVTRISKESFFSDLNHLEVAGMTSDHYASFFGFTEEEVFAAMDEQGLTNKAQVKEWYDGFRIGSHSDIYNPWSITNYLRHKEFKPYWVHSASNKLISNIFQPGDRERKCLLEDLLNGGCLFADINEEIAFQELAFHSEAVWSLLMVSGYLKIVGQCEDGRYKLIPTNKEVSIMLVDMVRGWFASADGYGGFLEALLLHDVDYMNEYMGRIMRSVFSYFDTASEPGHEQPERFYHGFILGLMVKWGKRYIIKSNRECGLGRADVTLEPRDPGKDPAFILEFKIHRPRREADLNETADAALRQIEEKKYAAEFISRGIKAENIYSYGLAFHGKEVLIKGSKEDSF